MQDESLWPEVSPSVKPWTRWWWLGNAVDKENISKRLAEFAEAGIGGVEITPIYGVKGYEERFLDHLSPDWMDMLIFTLDEAEKLDLGVDMVLGTGWPFGGPQVEPEYAAGLLHIQTYEAPKNKPLSQRITLDKTVQGGPMQLSYLFAFSEEGKRLDLLPWLNQGMLEWRPETDHTIYAIFTGISGQQVKRAAPGGEGLVLDHFSRQALMDYLDPYDSTLGPVRGKLRALFNDSYEVYGANFTPLLFEEFRKRRGYDLLDHLPDLINEEEERSYRVLSDYRETISDLLHEDFSVNWSRWANKHNFLTKYQAHGCPGNLLDIYATADIPECETFYATKFQIPGVRWEASDANLAQPDLIMLKFASSAAHISGKELTSSESLTWLREHFKSALSQCKPEIEQLFLSGVNHIFFHGSTYFPDEAPWPGWKFYASVNLVPSSTLWKDAPFLFDYITRCQSMLQSGRSDNEILVYWPFHETIGSYRPEELLLRLEIANIQDWLVPSDFYKLVSSLIEQGYSVDFISDNYLEKVEVTRGRLSLSGLDYQALLVPESKYMKAATFSRLAELSATGGRIIFKALPESVPGYHRYKEKNEQLQSLKTTSGESLIVASDPLGELARQGIHGEGLVEFGLDFVRRDKVDGKIYYLVNHSPQVIDAYVSLNSPAKSVVLMDPRTGDRGLGKLVSKKDLTEVYLQIQPGESLILNTFDTKKDVPAWQYNQKAGGAVELTGTWQLEFLEGGPVLPDSASFKELKSWTLLDQKAEAFSGTARYTLEFEHPFPEAPVCLLDLGDVRESARV
jgi:hypothetical protein